MGSFAESSAEEFIFRSKLPDIDIPNHLTLHTYCFQHASQYPSKPFIVNGPTGEVFTYEQVEKTAKRVATGLRKLGINKGDVIMLFLPNCPEFAFAFFAASFLGAASTTANPAYTPAEVQKQAAAAGAKLIVTESVSVPKVKDFTEERGLTIVCIDEAAPEGCIKFKELTAEMEFEEDVEIDPNDVVALPFSSGTTGLPKGVMLTHKSLITSVAQQVDGENPTLYFRNDDVILCLLPLFHIYSLSSILLCGARAGSAIVIMKKFDLKAMLELIQKYSITIAPFVPPIAVDLVKSPLTDEYDLSSIRMVMSGAAPMGSEVQNKLTAKIPNCKLGQGYGMTEAGSVLSMCLAFAKEPFPIKSGSCGTVIRNAEVMIIDPDTGISLPRNKAGEICIRGDQIMKGYLNDAKATAETIDDDGWLHTGDIGFIDNDDEMFIVDRMKEIIKYNGYQVAPAELEALLIAHPEIVGAGVVGMKSERSGEVPVAFVLKADGSKITEDEIKQYISKQVVFYKKIYKVFFTDSIPKNPSGKILRKVLRARLDEISL